MEDWEQCSHIGVNGGCDQTITLCLSYVATLSAAETLNGGHTHAVSNVESMDNYVETTMVEAFSTSLMRTERELFFLRPTVKWVCLIVICHGLFIMVLVAKLFLAINFSYCNCSFLFAANQQKFVYNLVVVCVAIALYNMSLNCSQWSSSHRVCSNT